MLSIKSHQKQLQMVAKLPLFYSRTLDGHRREYLDFTIGLFGGERTSSLGMFLSPRPVLFLMIEDSFALYCAVALWRSLFGWRTVGLLFRPKPAVEATSFRLRIKRQSLRFLRCINAVKTLSIIPVSLDPRFSEIVDGWIYDFQLWDISEADRSVFEALRNGYSLPEDCDPDAANLVVNIQSAANGRRIISAIGRQDQAKGFDQFALLADQDRFVRNWHFVVGGKVDASCEVSASSLIARGGTVKNRFVSDSEVISIYAVSDLIWCSYAESYDQASGILGRAVQFGLPVVVREGSFSHRLCVAEMLPHIPVSNIKKVRDEIFKLSLISPEQARATAQRFRVDSLKKLEFALGIAALRRADK